MQLTGYHATWYHPWCNVKLRDNWLRPALLEREAMVARTWHGSTAVEKADEYLEFLRTVGLSEYSSVEGSERAFVLRRLEGDVAHFILLSFWTSIDAIKAYSGEDVGVPRYHPNDRNYLLELEQSVEHYVVFSE
jgi:heme-degrading monooxygenase HmoA